MEILEFALLTLVGICMFALLAAPICNVLEDMLVYGDGGYGRARQTFREDARQRGLSFTESSDELLIREHLARLRRVASDSVAHDPENWFDHFEAARTDSFQRLQQIRPDLAPKLVAAVSPLNYGDILYPAEAELVDRCSPYIAVVRPTDDQIAALRVVK